MAGAAEANKAIAAQTVANDAPVWMNWSSIPTPLFIVPAASAGKGTTVTTLEGRIVLTEHGCETLCSILCPRLCSTMQCFC